MPGCSEIGGLKKFTEACEVLGHSKYWSVLSNFLKICKITWAFVTLAYHIAALEQLKFKYVIACWILNYFKWEQKY